MRREFIKNKGLPRLLDSSLPLLPSRIEFNVIFGLPFDGVVTSGKIRLHPVTLFRRHDINYALEHFCRTGLAVSGVNNSE